MFFERIKKERLLKKCALTPSGRCMLQYVRKLLKGEKDYIEAYEDFINRYMKSTGRSREETLKIISILGEKLEEANNE